MTKEEEKYYEGVIVEEIPNMRFDFKTQTAHVSTESSTAQAIDSDRHFLIALNRHIQYHRTRRR